MRLKYCLFLAFKDFMETTKINFKIVLVNNKCTLILFMYFYCNIFTNMFRPEFLPS